MRAKNFSLPFSLEEIEEAETENYNNDTDLADVNLNINAAMATKKISDKYKKIRRKEKETHQYSPSKDHQKGSKQVLTQKD